MSEPGDAAGATSPWSTLGPESLGFIGGEEKTTKDTPVPPTSTSESSLTTGGLSDLFDDDETGTAGELSVVGSAPETEAAPAGAAPIFGAPLVPEPVGASVYPGHPTALPGVGVREPSADLVLTENYDAEKLEEERRYFEAQLQAREYLYEIVDQMIELISQNADLQKMVNDFVLTRDLEQDRRQRADLEVAVSPRMLAAKIQPRAPEDIPVLFDLAYDELIGISVVGDLWRDENVDEILIDAWDTIVIERFGQLEDTGRRFRSSTHANSVARNLSRLLSDRSVSNTNPLVTALLPGARVQFAWGNVAKSGLSISIRKFRDLLGMGQLLQGDSLDEDMRDFLRDAVRARATILVSGGTGTGKTTMINALSESIPNSERVITIEDAYELTLANRHVVALQAKSRSSADDPIVITQEFLLTSSLRMRPDRIIVGEVRESSAVEVMLSAANTGHDGTMTTLHATNADGALTRMATLLMVAAPGYNYDIARLEVASAIDLVVHISRRGGHRFVSEIALVDPAYIGANSVGPLGLFEGEVSVSADDEGNVTEVHPTFRAKGKVPRATKLGMKLTDLGRGAERWLS